MCKTGTDIQEAVTYLLQGDIVAIPTETVYGLAGDATRSESVIRIYEAKERPSFNPLIVHIASVDEASKYTVHIPPILLRLASTFWPGPFTILAEKNTLIADPVTAGSPLVALRVPVHPMALELLHSLPFPLAAPSANLFGRISPTTAQHVAEQLQDRIPYILDGGPCSVGVESTIVKCNAEGEIVLLREGAITAAMIREITGKEPLQPDAARIEAPGMLKSHYAPIIPVRIGKLQEMAAEYDPTRIACLQFEGKVPIIPNARYTGILSPRGDLHEAAARLFALMHEAEASGADFLLAEAVPDTGIGRAINDRLHRASA
ncbi:MAG: L-threonylcarbamoyladenylate synthase [Chitinophagales bacterium]